MLCWSAAWRYFGFGQQRIPKGTPGVSASVVFATERDQRYLGYFNFIYGEVGVGMRLGGVENLHYGDGSECVFAKLLEGTLAQ